MATTSATNAAGATKQSHSPLFLAIFGAFLVASAIATSGVIYSIAAGTIQDWISYWASAQLLVQHANPYDSTAVVQLERLQGLNPRTHVLIARNPPSALFLMAPLGYMNARMGGLAWRLLQAGLLALCIYVLWILYGRPAGRWHWVAFTSAGCLACIASGQTTIIALAGLVFFLALHRIRPFLAGMALSLCAVKPHLFLPLAAALLVWVLANRKFRLMLGALAALAIEVLFPLRFDPSLFQHYQAAMRGDGIQVQFMPALAVALRFLLHSSPSMWISFLPALAGSVWAAWYFLRRRKTWDWSQEAPLLLLVSLLVAPYAWPVDAVLAVPAIVALIPRSSQTVLAALLALMTITAVQYCLRAGYDSPWLLWQTPAWLLWYLYARKRSAVIMPMKAPTS